MRRTTLIRNSGPYKVNSCANGEVRMHPQWPQYRPWTAKTGGGPGLLTRLSLAAEIERLLNGGKTFEEAKEEKP